jgi:cytoskeleton protein RodZ
VSEAQEPIDQGNDIASADALPADGGRIGPILARAREARGLGINDVVQTLKFNPRQIELLEADDIEALPGAMFVRGMIRSYARFLRIDPEPLLARLASRMPTAAPDVRPPDNMGNAMPNVGVRQIPMLVALSVLLLVFAATLVTWHFFGDRRPGEKASASTANSEARDGGAADPAPQGAGSGMSASPAIESSPMVAAPPATAVQAGAVGRQLTFDFLGTSWVEVKDATEQIIFTGQYGPGIRQVVAGSPPFQIVIGSAAGVELRYDDSVIDLKPHTRAEVARLTLE